MPSIFRNPSGVSRRVLIVSRDAQVIQTLGRQLAEANHVAEAMDQLDALRRELIGGGCLAAILDLDSLALDNAAVRELVRLNPAICVLGVSRERLHPNLQEAIRSHLQACLSSPVDSDELRFWLRCAAEQRQSSRAPPAADPRAR